jgi:hypothetical protein
MVILLMLRRLLGKEGFGETSQMVPQQIKFSASPDCGPFPPTPSPRGLRNISYFTLILWAVPSHALPREPRIIEFSKSTARREPGSPI